MKFGFDLHGILDSFPAFPAMTQALVAAGEEVHILTGPSWSEDMEKKLKDLGVAWTHYFSIIDYRQAQGMEINFHPNGRVELDTTSWDSAKAEYCKANGIDIHFDDSPVYGNYFETLYMKRIKPEDCFRCSGLGFKDEEVLICQTCGGKGKI